MRCCVLTGQLPGHCSCPVTAVTGLQALPAAVLLAAGHITAAAAAGALMGTPCSPYTITRTHRLKDFLQDFDKLRCAEMLPSHFT